MAVIISGSSGITSVNGSAAAPSVTGTDTDTGIVYGTNTITLATGGTAGLYQDASQNVGVGGTTPSAWYTGSKVLQINTMSFEGRAASSYSGIFTNAYIDAAGANYIYSSSNAATFYRQNGGAHAFLSAASGTAGASLTWTTVLTVSKDNTLALQGGSSGAGVGISFPATQVASTDANTLDDYEEGTWTPSVGGTATYNSRNATYTKVGRMVTVQCDMAINTIGTGSTTQVSGLPFAALNVTNGYYSAPLGYWLTMSKTLYFLNGLVGPGLSFVYFEGLTAPSDTLIDNIAIFRDGSRIIFSCTYAAA